MPKKRSSNKRKGSTLAAEPRKIKKTNRLVDLRGVPLLKHPGVVSREMERANTGDYLEIITDDPRRLEMAPKMLERIEGLQILDIWKEGTIATHW